MIEAAKVSLNNQPLWPDDQIRSSRQCAATCAAWLVAISLTLTGASAQSQSDPTSRPRGILGGTDHRLAIAPEQWPWSSIGRVNLVLGPAHRGHCTGTLVGARHVLTAAHCLFNTRMNTWAKPSQIHFVAGQSRSDRFIATSPAIGFLTAPGFEFELSARPRWNQIAPAMVAKDWAVIELRDTIPLQPVPLQSKTKAESDDQPNPELARAGYSQDRAYSLSVHRGCSVWSDPVDPNGLIHRCDSLPGDSGSPILLLRGDSAAIVGMHTVTVQHFEPGVGYRAQVGRGVSAKAFGSAVERLNQ